MPQKGPSQRAAETLVTGQPFLTGQERTPKAAMSGRARDPSAVTKT